MNKPKILIFSCFDNGSHEGCSYKELASITMPTYQEYCKVHSYDFMIRDKDFNPNRKMCWEKYQIFIDNIPKYDYIFYIECDSMLMNQTIRLENLIDDNYEILISKTSRKDIIEVNTGPILIKCSEWNKNFFQKLIDNEPLYRNHQMLEQQCITDEINKNEEVRKKCKIVNLRFFNSFYHEWHQENNFKPGDMILHCAGTSNKFRFDLFNFLKDHIIKVPDYKIPFAPFL